MSSISEEERRKARLQEIFGDSSDSEFEGESKKKGNKSDEGEKEEEEDDDNQRPQQKILKKKLKKSGSDESKTTQKKTRTEKSSRDPPKSISKQQESRSTSSSKRGGSDADDSDDENLLNPTEEDQQFIDDTKMKKGWVNPDGSDEDVSEEDYRRPKEAIEDNDEIQAAISRVNGRGRKRKTIKTDEEKEAEAKDLIEKMNIAAEKDIIANQNEQPALAKLNMLKEVIQVTQKRYLQTTLLDQDILSAIRAWLEPLPDKSLPNIQLRNELLSALKELPCGIDHLKRSRVGEIVMFLFNNKEETSKNKTICKGLIEKWSRPLFALSANYRDLTSRREQESQSIMPEPRQSQKTEPNKKRKTLDDALDASTEGPRPGDGKFNWHATIPDEPLQHYTSAPPSRYGSQRKEARYEKGWSKKGSVK